MPARRPRSRRPRSPCTISCHPSVTPDSLEKGCKRPVHRRSVTLSPLNKKKSGSAAVSAASGTAKTPKASPFNSRGYERSEHPRMEERSMLSTPRGSPNPECRLSHCHNGRPLWGRYLCAGQQSGGAPHAPATERRRPFPTCGRLPVAFQRLTLATDRRRAFPTYGRLPIAFQHLVPAGKRTQKEILAVHVRPGLLLLTRFEQVFIFCPWW